MTTCSFPMQKNIKEKFPQWTKEIDSSKHNLILTNDLDSLISCLFLKHHFGLEINYFYSFNRLWAINPDDQRTPIGVDCALRHGMTFDNHVTALHEESYINPLSANLNAVQAIHSGNYTSKFAMSTLIQLYALYDIPLPETIQGKMILLCTDVGFKGYYSDAFRQTYLNHLEALGMLDLIYLLDAYPRDDMYQFLKKAKLDSSIQMRKNRFEFVTDSLSGVDTDWFSTHLGFNITLPKDEFKEIARLTNKVIKLDELDESMLNDAISYAFINSRTLMISKRKEN